MTMTDKNEPTEPKPLRPRGKPLRRSEAGLARAATITPEDVQSAMAAVEKYATPKGKALAKARKR